MDADPAIPDPHLNPEAFADELDRATRECERAQAGYWRHQNASWLERKDAAEAWAAAYREALLGALRARRVTYTTGQPIAMEDDAA